MFGFTVTTDGYPLPRISKTGTLPPGVYLADNGDGTATISGTPDKSALGPYTITLDGREQGRKDTSRPFTLTVEQGTGHRQDPRPPLPSARRWTWPSPPPAIPRRSCTNSGTLPAGLSFTNTGNGQAAITGTPAKDTGGSRAITITATSTSSERPARPSSSPSAAPNLARVSAVAAGLNRSLRILRLSAVNHNAQRPMARWPVAPNPISAAGHNAKPRLARWATMPATTRICAVGQAPAAWARLAVRDGGGRADAAAVAGGRGRA